MNEMTKEAGVPKVTLRSLRHTNITLQIMEGIPVVTIAQQAGHARPSTTSDIYAYFFQSVDEKAAATLDEIFS